MKSSWYFVAGATVALLLALSVSVTAEEPKKADDKKVEDKSEAPAKTSTPVALTLEAIQELEARKKSLDARERELEERAKNLDIQEKVLSEKLRRMEELNKKMAERLDGFKKEHEQRVTKLVTVVESMRPQAAADYVSNLDPDLAVEILARIQVAKASKILNLVDKKIAAKLTELYTGYRRAMQEASTPQTPENKEVPQTGKM